MNHAEKRDDGINAAIEREQYNYFKSERSELFALHQPNQFSLGGRDDNETIWQEWWPQVLGRLLEIRHDDAPVATFSIGVIGLI